MKHIFTALAPRAPKMQQCLHYAIRASIAMLMRRRVSCCPSQNEAHRGPSRICIYHSTMSIEILSHQSHCC
uniref:GRAS49 n=1 Tax=Arundo donax TaxID=35708 RepID=A0A0A9CB92_ARUDO